MVRDGAIAPLHHEEIELSRAEGVRLAVSHQMQEVLVGQTFLRPQAIPVHVRFIASLKAQFKFAGHHRAH